jgi:hypothetical protein
MFNIENAWEASIAILLAAAGGLSRLLSTKDTSKLQLSRTLSELFVSCFSGLMVLLLARSFGLKGDWLGLVCGMAGWIGPRILDMVAKPAGQAIGLDVGALKEKEQQSNHTE